MSVGEEQTECPLCMELLEMDDINFFPCTCGYQICRFCWHRIRTDENGLCPACRKQYPEDPAEFKPLTDDELQRIKKERKQKDFQRKQKAAENRKHLANVRVVQKNLVFVVGLSQRLADPDVLRRNEYFGKFGRIHKVVINHSTSYAGAQSSSQGPSASAYVTYRNQEDTLRAIQTVNNIHVDGRTLKASLGTTKYCSHFLKGSQCPKSDCMYLHELGEEAASFTKEEMQQGRHTEYEQELHEKFMNSQNLSNTQQQPATTTATTTNTTQHTSKSQRKKTGSPLSDESSQDGGSSGSGTPPALLAPGPLLPPPPAASTPPATGTGSLGPGKDAWPSLSSSGAGTPSSQSPETVIGRPERMVNGKSKSKHDTGTTDVEQQHNRAPGHHRSKHSNNTGEPEQNSISGGTLTPTHSTSSSGGSAHELLPPSVTPPSTHALLTQQQQHALLTSAHTRLRGSQAASLYAPNDSMSLFSSGTGFSANRQNNPPVPPSQLTESIPATEIPDTIPVASSTDWQAAFGFGSAPSIPQTVAPPVVDQHNDDDLGFDPWDESSKALADLIEKETNSAAMTSLSSSTGFMGFSHGIPRGNPNPNPPPGLHNHLQQQAVHSQMGVGGHPAHHPAAAKTLPPGLAPNHIGAFNTSMPPPPPSGYTGSKILGLMQMSGGGGGPPSTNMPPPNLHTMPPNHHQGVGVPPNAGFNDLLGDVTSLPIHKQHQQHHNNGPPHPQNSDVFNMKDWQEGLRALLPNINIHFGTPPYGAAHPDIPPPPTHTQHTRNDWLSEQQQQQNAAAAAMMAPPPPPPPADLSWDPAIVTSGNVATEPLGNNDDAQPHWMASLQNLTDETSNHRLPFVQQFPTFTTGVNWAAQSQHPPPGFQPAPLRQQSTEQNHTLEAGVQ